MKLAFLVIAVSTCSFLYGCMNPIVAPHACPTIKEFSTREQLEASSDLDNIPHSHAIWLMFEEYKGLRDAAKECNKN